MPYLKLGGGTPTEITSSGTYTLSNGTETIDVYVDLNSLPTYDTSDVIGVSKVIRRGFVYLNGDTGTPSITSNIIDEYNNFDNGSYSLLATNTNEPPHRLSSFSQTIYDMAYGNVIDIILPPLPPEIETNDITYEGNDVIGNGNIISINNNTLNKRGFCYTTDETDPTNIPSPTNWIIYEEPTTTIDSVSIITDNFDDLTQWSFEESGTIEINPAGQLHLLQSLQQSSLEYVIEQPIMVSGNSVELETSQIFNQLGILDFQNQIMDAMMFFVGIYNTEPMFPIYLYAMYATNGIFTFDPTNESNPVVQIGTTIPSYGVDAVWQDWKWRITGSTLDVLLKVDGVYVSQGTFTLPQEFTGGAIIGAMMSSISSTIPVEVHIDSFKVNTLSTTTIPLSTGIYSLPLSAVGSTDEFRVRAYTEYNDTEIVYGNTVINIPSTLSFTPVSGYAGDEVTITSGTYGFTENTIVSFFSHMDTQIKSYTDTQIIVYVPPGTLGGQIEISEVGKETVFTDESFVILSPYIISMTPSGGYVGDVITVTGRNFAYISSINFDGIPAEIITNDNLLTMTVKIPTGISYGSVPVTLVSGFTEPVRTPPNFEVYPFSISGFTPEAGFEGDSVSISGSRFDETTRIWFNPGAEAIIESYTDIEINTHVPVGAITGLISASHYDLWTVSSQFIVIILSIEDVQPRYGYYGDEVILTGTGFDETTTVEFGGGVSASVFSFTETTITTHVPSGSIKGPVIVYKMGKKAETAFDFEPMPTHDRYWINNSGNWTDQNHWSYGYGLPNGARIPTSQDNIYFTTDSFSTSGQIVTVDDPQKFRSGVISAGCIPFTMNIDTSLTCHLDWTMVSGSEINGLFILNPSASWYGSGDVEELYCFPETTIWGTNTIGILSLDTGDSNANFNFEPYSIQTINNLEIFGTSPSAQALVKLTSNSYFTIILGETSNVEFTTFINCHVSGGILYALFTKGCIDGTGNEGIHFSLPYWSIIDTNGLVFVTNTTIKNSHAMGGATFNSYTAYPYFNVNAGGNTGWNWRQNYDFSYRNIKDDLRIAPQVIVSDATGTKGH